MRRLCTICVRGGSKGVPGKNLAMVAGKPLVAHSIDHARMSGVVDAVAVSSDSDAILAVAADSGADLVIERPGEMASDVAPKVDAIRHAVLASEEALGWTADIVVDLDATSPLRDPSDVVGAVALLESTGASNVITGAPARRSPYFNLVERRDDGTVGLVKPLPEGVVRRQDAPETFDMNASIYVWWRDLLVNEPAVFYPDTHLYEMPETRSLDIDTQLDLELVRHLMAREGHE